MKEENVSLDNENYIERLEDYVEELQRQKNLLQRMYDFGDVIETHALIEKEVQKVREDIKFWKQYEKMMDMRV